MSPFRKWHHILLVGTVETIIASLNICHSDLPISGGRGEEKGAEENQELWEGKEISLSFLEKLWRNHS